MTCGVHKTGIRNGEWIWRGKLSVPGTENKQPPEGTKAQKTICHHFIPWKEKSEIPAPYALLSNRNLKTNPFPSRPLPQGDPFWGQKNPPKQIHPPWNECCYTTIIVIMCEHNWKKKRIKKKETLSRKKIKQKASPL